MVEVGAGNVEPNFYVLSLALRDSSTGIPVLSGNPVQDPRKTSGCFSCFHDVFFFFFPVKSRTCTTRYPKC